MTFPTAILTCLRKYVTFSGRASRSEYWWFFLFVFLGSLVLGFVDSVIFGTTMVETAPGRVSLQSNGPLASLFALAMVLPALAVGWRRMHDSDRSGFFLLYPLIAALGIATAFSFFGGLGALNGGALSGLAMLVLLPAMIVAVLSPLLVLWWLTRPGTPGTNAFGLNPHEVQS